MKPAHRPPENESVSKSNTPDRHHASRRTRDLAQKTRRRRRRPSLLKAWSFAILGFSMAIRASPLLLSQFFHSCIDPLLGVTAFSPPKDRRQPSVRFLPARDKLCLQTSRHHEVSWRTENRLACFRLAASPSQKRSPQNIPTFGASNNNLNRTSSFSGSANRRNRFSKSTTSGATPEVGTNVASKALDSRRPNSSGKSSSGIRAKVEETRQRQAAKKDGSQAQPLLTQAYCDYLLAECVSHDEWELVLDVLDMMKEADLRQVRSTYAACLQACFQTANAASAREILSAMVTAQIPPETSDYALAILAMCRKDQTEKGWWRKALQLVQEVTVGRGNDDSRDDLPLAAYDAILTCMVEDRQWKESIRLLRIMEQPMLPGTDATSRSSTHGSNNKTRPALSTYRTVIECCVASNEAEQAAQVLRSCVGSGVTPTPYAFELVIGALSKKLQWRRALQLLDLMEELGVPRTLQIYNFVLTSCAKAREAVQAKAVLQRMRRRDGIAPNIISYNSVMSACASTSRWRDALAVLDLAHREPGVTPDVYTYTNAIRACAKGGKTERALSLFQVVKDKGLPLDSYCYTAAIEACEWRQALNLLADMEERGIEPSEVAYSVTIKACGEGGQWRKALDLVESMRSKKMPINLYVYNAAITAVSRAAKQRSKSGDSYGQFWTEVMALLEHMRRDGIEPDGFSFSSAISCCGSEGRWQEALELIDVMLKGGPKTRPNKIAYTAAITSCGRAGQVGHSIRLFRQMKEQGLSADRVAYNALFSALRVSKKSEAAFALWDEMLGQTSKQSGTTNIATARSWTVPDIITVTDAIGAMSSEADLEADRLRVDKVFAEAVRLGAVLREESPVPSWQFDLQSMSFPVARAACRFVLNRIQHSNSESLKDLIFVTGIGAKRQTGSGLTSLRDYVQEILVRDFSPGLVSIVPERAQGTVEIKAETLAAWMNQEPIFKRML